MVIIGHHPEGRKNPRLPLLGIHFRPELFDILRPRNHPPVS